MAADIIFWTGVKVDAQTELGVETSIEDISAASEGVVESTGHGLTDGDYVLLSVSGMIEVNSRVFRVSDVSADEFTLQDEDTREYGDFISGSFRKITFGVSAATLQDVNVSGGEANMADTTTIHDLEQSQAPTTTTPLTMQHTSLFSGSDPFLAEMRRASRSKTTRAVRYTFTNGDEVLVNAYVSASGAPTGQAGQAVQTPLTLAVQRAPTTVAAA